MKKLLPLLIFFIPVIIFASVTTVPWIRLNSSAVYPIYSTDQVEIGTTATSSTASLDIEAQSGFLDCYEFD